MGEAIKILVSLEEDLKSELAEAVLAVEPEVQIIGMSEDLEGRWNTATEQAADLLMVACGGYSQRALTFIDRTVKENPDRPVVVLAEGPVNGFVKRVFEAGASEHPPVEVRHAAIHRPHVRLRGRIDEAPNQLAARGVECNGRVSCRHVQRVPDHHGARVQRAPFSEFDPTELSEVLDVPHVDLAQG